MPPYSLSYRHLMFGIFFLQDVDARVAAAEVPIRELQSIIEKHREDHGDEIQLAESRLSTLQQQAATLSSATQAVKK